jgi:3-dehydroquinate synthase
MNAIILEPMENEAITVNLGPRRYEIVVGSSIRPGFASFLQRCCPRSRSAAVVCDGHVEAHARGFTMPLPTTTIVVPAGESTKCMAQAERLYDALADIPADRNTVIVAVGGGVIGDLAGFVAATYNRGLPLVMAPTTLLAMVDSSVGGKVGINHPKGKNLIGAFYQPAGVWIDTQYLESLPDREFRSGLAEVVKYGVILDAEFFDWLDQNADAVLRRDPAAIRYIVARSCRLKADVVEKDEREEMGLRIVLNYGHTFAHAFETAAGYGKWLHGEAVAAGMVCASRLAEQLGMIPSEVTERQIRLLNRFGLPTRPLSWPAEQLLAIMHRDKKALAGKLRFVLPTRIGEVQAISDIEVDIVLRVLSDISRA